MHQHFRIIYPDSALSLNEGQELLIKKIVVNYKVITKKRISEGLISKI